MEQQLTQFISSDTAGIMAVVLVVLGVFDVASGWYLIRYKRDLLPVSDEKLHKMMLPLFFAAIFMALIGLYILGIRG